MWFKHRAWVPVAWLLSGGNLVAAWFAAVPGEAWHAATHALLAVVFAVAAERLSRRRSPGTEGEAELRARVQELEDRVAEIAALPDAGSRLAELEERLDFAERAMVEVRKRSELPPRS
jgi:membrane protein implicated in regulation of membrane protease activity